MKVKGKKVKVVQGESEFIGYLIDESPNKFIVANEKGKVLRYFRGYEFPKTVY